MRARFAIYNRGAARFAIYNRGAARFAIYYMGVVGMLLVGSWPRPGWAGQSVEVKDGSVLLGGVAVAELPAGLEVSGVVADGAGQDVVVEGRLAELGLVQLRYGRKAGEGALVPVQGQVGVGGAGMGLSALVPERAYTMSDRVLRLVFGVGKAAVRRGILVGLAPGSSGAQVKLDAGTCKRTQFLVGDYLGVPVAATEVVVSATRPQVVLWAEQAAPGEDCVAWLRTTAGAAGLRLVGGAEGSGSSVVLADRSWSMERPLHPGVEGSEVARAEGVRQGLRALLGGLLVLQQAGVGVGSWAVMPFGDGVGSVPGAGFLGGAGLLSVASGLRVEGFAGSAADDLWPSGASNFGGAMRAAGERLKQDGGGGEGPFLGGRRRVWMMTDGLAAGDVGRGEYGVGMVGAGLRVIGVSGPMKEAGWGQVQGRVNMLAGERGVGLGEMAQPRTLGEMGQEVVGALVKDVLGGRAIGTRAEGRVMGSEVASEWGLSGAEPWVMGVVTWEHEGAAVEVEMRGNGVVARGPCTRAGVMAVCVAAGYAGSWRMVARGRGPMGAAEPVQVGAYVSGAGVAGQVGVRAGWGRSVYRSGERMRLEVKLSEQGMPLRLAKVTAVVRRGEAAVGGRVGSARVVMEEVARLVKGNGDLTAGQARWELSGVAVGEVVERVEMNDGGRDGDVQAGDGVYGVELEARVPGGYRADVRIEHSGLLTGAGVIEERVEAQVVTGLDGGRTSASVEGERIEGGVRVKFVPQDRYGGKLGPGYGGGLRFYREGVEIAARVGDTLDGGYVAELLGVESGLVEVASMGGRIVLLDAAQVKASAAGCGVVGGGVGDAGGAGGAGGAGLVMVVGMVVVVRRRREWMRQVWWSRQ